MSYKTDKKEFEEKYGKNAVANSIDVKGMHFWKVRNDRKWELLITIKGKLRSFNKGVVEIFKYSLEIGDVPQFHYIVDLKTLKRLKEEIDKILKRVGSHDRRKY